MKDIAAIAKFFDISSKQAEEIYNSGWTLDRIKEYSWLEPATILGIIKLSKEKNA